MKLDTSLHTPEEFEKDHIEGEVLQDKLNSADNCKNCAELMHLAYDGVLDDVLACELHRQPTSKGYKVLCRKCGSILISDSPDDSLCGYCI